MVNTITEWQDGCLFAHRFMLWKCGSEVCGHWKGQICFSIISLKICFVPQSYRLFDRSLAKGTFSRNYRPEVGSEMTQKCRSLVIFCRNYIPQVKWWRIAKKDFYQLCSLPLPEQELKDFLEYFWIFWVHFWTFEILEVLSGWFLKFNSSASSHSKNSRIFYDFEWFLRFLLERWDFKFVQN